MVFVPHCLAYFTIKDTWTKSRGRVEVGEGGGFGWVGWREREKRHTSEIE